MTRIVIGLLLLILTARPAPAQIPCSSVLALGTLERKGADSVVIASQVKCAIALQLNGWMAEFWRIPHRPNIPNQPLAPALPTEAPFLTRLDSAINFTWGIGPVDPRYPSDTNGIYARWTRLASFDGGTYRFTATVDDGVKLFVDGTQIITSWIEQPATAYSADHTLTPGSHLIELHWYENQGGASVKLVWTRLPDAAPTGPQAVVSVTLIPQEGRIIMVPGQTRQLHAVTSYSDGFLGTNNGALQWQSDGVIASVSTGNFAGVTPNGTLKALTAGLTTVIVRDSATAKADTVEVQVVQGELPAPGVFTSWLGFLGCPVTVGSTCVRGPYPVYADDGAVLARVTVQGTFTVP